MGSRSRGRRMRKSEGPQGRMGWLDAEIRRASVHNVSGINLEEKAVSHSQAQMC